MKIVILGLFFLSVDPASHYRINLETILKEEWDAYKLTYNKTYESPEEEQFRREIFIENRHKIATFNQEYSLGQHTFVQQLNVFSDMLHHEFHGNLNGFNTSAGPDARTFDNFIASTFIPSFNVQIPQSIDWRDLGAVTPVKSQGLCAACWAFSAAGALEGHTFRKTGHLEELSPQNLIDCTRHFGNDGCKGGLLNPAFQYIKDNHGIDVDPAYPFEAIDGQCRFRPEAIGAICTGYVNIPAGDEQALEIAVATMGPVAAAIDASPHSFQFYADGVYYDTKCNSQTEELNHAVLIVGYGVEPNGQRYWIVKNSYGQQWGRGGYVKIAKDANNHCGIATEASYPLV